MFDKPERFTDSYTYVKTKSPTYESSRFFNKALAAFQKDIIFLQQSDHIPSFIFS